jgi:ribosomal protein S18 acetylase RimI-like enzyme
MRLQEAEQIAALLNKHNALQSVYDGNRVLHSKARYYPQVYKGIVVGSIALMRWNFIFTEVKHLVVHPRLRGHGLGKRMLRQALATTATPLMYATVREDNLTSLHLFVTEGFTKIARITMADHNVALLMKANNG